MKITSWTACPLGALALLPLSASAELVQAPFGPGGTWNVYEVVTTPATFKDAHNAASAKFDPINGTIQGHLVSIHSEEENTFVSKNLFPNQNVWIGLSDRAGVAPGASESQITENNRTLGWKWTSGEDFTFQKWGDGEPNNAGDGEDAAHIRNDGFWNDNGSGYGLNEPVADPQSQGESAPTMGYVVEYRTQSATPLPGIALGSVLPAPGTLNVPAPTTAAWSIREVTGLTLAGNSRDTVAKIQSGEGTSHYGQSPVLNRTDPQTNATGGPIISDPSEPFLSNTDADDNDIATAAKGRIKVTEAGTYTIQVRSDDGFALRVVGQEFQSVNGNGYIDPVDRSTISFHTGTGDANTRGVIYLDEGVYDVEFIHWEGNGGAYYEVTSAQGAITDPSQAQWLLLGDGTRLEARNSNPVRLNGEATVRNAANPSGGNNLAAAKAAFSNPETTTYSKTVSTLDIPEEQMPIAEQTDPSIRDNYVTEIIGKLLVDDGKGSSGDIIGITFHLASDDGSSLQIIGEDFLSVTDFSDSGDAVLAEENGDMIMVADYPTGNTNAFGYIELEEGEYDFRILHTEGGGGSNFRLYYALGDWTERGWDPAAFQLVTTANFILPANQGLGLVVPEPTVALLGLSALGLLTVRRRR